MLKLVIVLVTVAVIAIMVAVALEANARTARMPEDEYIVMTYKVIDSLMRDAANIRDFTIDGEGRSCIVTLIDSDFKTIERQGPRWTWHKLVHEVVDEWREGR